VISCKKKNPFGGTRYHIGRRERSPMSCGQAEQNNFDFCQGESYNADSGAERRESGMGHQYLKILSEKATGKEGTDAIT